MNPIQALLLSSGVFYILYIYIIWNTCRRYILADLAAITLFTYYLASIILVYFGRREIGYVAVPSSITLSDAAAISMLLAIVISTIRTICKTGGKRPLVILSVFVLIAMMIVVFMTTASLTE